MRARASVRIFAYYTAILGAIYNMRRTKKAKGQMVRKRELHERDEEDERERMSVMEGERARERERKGEEREAASIQKHRV